MHEARPDVVGAVHAHGLQGKAFSSLHRLLSPITQDACAFYEDHSIYDEYHGVALDEEEGLRIAAALGPRKAVVLSNHGHLTVGTSVESAVWWYVSMERSMQAELALVPRGILLRCNTTSPSRRTRPSAPRRWAGSRTRPSSRRSPPRNPHLRLTSRRPVTAGSPADLPFAGGPAFRRVCAPVARTEHSLLTGPVSYVKGTNVISVADMNASSNVPTELEVDILIIGAGPAGLYGAYYAGFRGLRVAVLDALSEPGGQVSAMYRRRPSSTSPDSRP